MKSVVAALLHDVVEDTEYSVEDMERIFGPKIASMVDGLTKMSGSVQRRHLGAGRIFPQSAADPSPDDVRVILDKDRRPPAQHAHAGGDADEQADQDHGRDDLPLRSAGLPAGTLLDQKRTGGPLHEVPLPAAVRRNHAETARKRKLRAGSSSTSSTPRSSPRSTATTSITRFRDA